MQNVSQFNIPGLSYGDLSGNYYSNGECWSEPISFSPLCRCLYIEELDQLGFLDELIYVKEDEIIGINVQMNADELNDQLYQIDVFSPSLLTLGTTNKIYIVDIVKLGMHQELDQKLTQVF